METNNNTLFVDLESIAKRARENGDFSTAITIYTSLIEQNEKGNKDIKDNGVMAGYYLNRGFAREQQGNQDEDARKDYERALELNENSYYIKLRLGSLLQYKLNRLDEAIDYYTQIIDANERKSGYPHAYYNRAEAYKEKNRLAEAIEDLENAGRRYIERGEFIRAERTHKLLKQLQEKLENDMKIVSDGSQIQTATADGDATLTEKSPESPAALTESERDYASEITKMFSEDEEARALVDTFNSQRSKRYEFLKPGGSNQGGEKEGFWVLRRWNSYTPIISGTSNMNKGGGYFFLAKGIGIVIDPGMNFIDNFISQGFKFCDIDYVIATHDHNDHTADLESIITLLYQYNREILGKIDDLKWKLKSPFKNDSDTAGSIEESASGEEPSDDMQKDNKTYVELSYNEYIKERSEKPSTDDGASIEKTAEDKFAESEKRKEIRLTDADWASIEKTAKDKFAESGKRKKITFYITKSTFQKYSGIFELKGNLVDYDIRVVEPEDDPKPDSAIILRSKSEKNEKYDIRVNFLKAKHYTELSDRDSIGVLLQTPFLRDNDIETAIAEDKDSERFKLLYTGDTGYNFEMGEYYKKVKQNFGNIHVILTNLGSFKDSEAHYNDKDSNKEECFYTKHLGRLGIAKAVETLRPAVCLISEFGEEFRNIRKQVADVFQRAKLGDTKFFATDIGFCINAAAKIRIRAIKSINTPKHCFEYDFIEFDKVSTIERELLSALHYYAFNERSRHSEQDLAEYLIAYNFVGAWPNNTNSGMQA
jgi:ribonuclease BN (tRNA processing enzyme)